ncbi:hypothetical protein OHS70_09500 [Streptomyces sp. NBC_00390]|uniref:hypothetical protein n=1 Tax=Streptomyces sp. NBC_00390 TaxID=2975736 RepID=UPI002E24AB66
MGVFSWFRSKPTVTAEASTEEAGTTGLAAGSAAGTTSGPASDTEGPARAEAGLTEETGADETESVPSGPAAVEGVEIPKQQSAGEAADNEAGEGARK